MPVPYNGEKLLDVITSCNFLTLSGGEMRQRMWNSCTRLETKLLVSWIYTLFLSLLLWPSEGSSPYFRTIPVPVTHNSILGQIIESKFFFRYPSVLSAWPIMVGCKEKEAWMFAWWDWLTPFLQGVSFYTSNLFGRLSFGLSRFRQASSSPWLWMRNSSSLKLIG